MIKKKKLLFNFEKIILFFKDDLYRKDFTEFLSRFDDENAAIAPPDFSETTSNNGGERKRYNTVVNTCVYIRSWNGITRGSSR